MMKSYRVILFLISLILAVSSCELETNTQITVTGTGDVVSKTVDVSPFSKFRIDGTADVFISIGDVQSVALKAQQEILDVMTFVVSSDKLTVSQQQNVNIVTDKGIQVDITVPNIEIIEINGAAHIELEGEKRDNLSIVINGTGYIEAYAMPVDNCSITVSGIGTCKVWVNNSLDVKISGVGYIYHKGDPSVSTSISGVGEVIDDN